MVGGDLSMLLHQRSNYVHSVHLHVLHYSDIEVVAVRLTNLVLSSKQSATEMHVRIIGPIASARIVYGGHLFNSESDTGILQA